MMVTITNIKIATESNEQLSANVYENSTVACKGVLIVCSAMGVKQTFYADFASFMAEQGLIVYTFDYRGMGSSLSASIKHCTADLADWAVGVQKISVYAQSTHPKLPLFAVTHSVGGQLLVLTEAAKNWDGIITVASQSGYWKHWTGKHRLRLWFFWHLLLPGLSTIMGYFPAKKLGLFENLPKEVALQWSKWGRHPLYLKREFPTAYFGAINCPIHAYSFSDDEEFGPKPAVDWLHEQFDEATVERFHINPKEKNINKVGHFGFFRASMKSTFWETAYSFFEKESNKRLVKL